MDIALNAIQKLILDKILWFARNEHHWKTLPEGKVKFVVSFKRFLIKSSRNGDIIKINIKINCF